MLQRREEAEEALELAVASAPSDAAVLQAQIRMQGSPAPVSASPARKAGRLSKMLGRRGAASAPEPEIQHVSDGSGLHAVAPPQRPSDAVIELQLSHVLDEMGLAPGSTEREAAKSLGMDQKWSMVEAAAAKRVVDQSTKAQEYAAAQAALAKRAGQGGAGGFIERSKAALSGDSSGRDGPAEGEVGLITHWDGTSSVVNPAGRQGGTAAGAGGDISTGGSDTRWMCVEPDIAWRQVEFLEAEDVMDASADSGTADNSDTDTPHYTIYRMRAHTVDGRKWEVAKRYSEFVAFREELLEAGLGISHLSFPPKTTFGRTNERHVARRMTQLQAWMTALIATYPDQVLIGVFLHADSDLAQLETLRMKWAQPERTLKYQPKGWSPLHTAVQRGDLVAVEDAIEEGYIMHCRGMASSDEEGEESSTGTTGREPLMLDAVDCNGQTAMHRAAALGYADIVFALLGAGASPSVVSCSGHTPLHISAREGFASIVAQLCVAVKQQSQAMDTSVSPSLDVPSQTGDTPLHYAAVAADTNTVRVLLAHGASPHVTNMLANTPLDALTQARGHGSLGEGDDDDGTQPAGGDDEALREITEMLQRAMREQPPPPPRPPPRPVPKEQRQQQTTVAGQAVGVEDRSSVALVRAVIQGGTAGELRCVCRTTVRDSPDLASRKVGSLPVGTTVTAHETVELQLKVGSHLRFRIGQFGQMCGWVSLHSSKSGTLLFEPMATPLATKADKPGSAAHPIALSATRPTWEYSRDLSRLCANGSLWCSGAPQIRHAAAALHAFYQEHCLEGAGADQLLASPRSVHGDKATNGGEAMTLYDDDSWLQDDQDSPMSIRSDTDADGISPKASSWSASPTSGASDGGAARDDIPVSASPQPQGHQMGTPDVFEVLVVAADAVGRFAPAARSLLLQAIEVDQDCSRGRSSDLDAAASALELYTQGLQVAMGAVRKVPHDKDSMKKSLEPYFARAFTLRSEVAAAKTAKEAAIAALAKKNQNAAAASATIAEGVPPRVAASRMPPQLPALTLSPRSLGAPSSPQPDDPGYQAFLAARQALKGTLKQPSPGSSPSS
jgi:hypothetical protein